MSELDWIIAIVVGVSTLVGITRGMMREIFALGGWIAAFFVSLHYASFLADKLPITSVGPLVRTLLAVVLITIACVFTAGLLGKIIRSILASVSIGAEDRFLGCLFGFLRGLLIIGILVFFAGKTDVVRQQWWKSSEFVPLVAKGIDRAMPWLPKEFL